MNYSVDSAVERIEARAASGQLDFCIGISDDWIAISVALRDRGWSVRSIPSGIYGVEVIEVTRP